MTYSKLNKAELIALLRQRDEEIAGLKIAAVNTGEGGSAGADDREGSAPLQDIIDQTRQLQRLEKLSERLTLASQLEAANAALSASKQRSVLLKDVAEGANGAQTVDDALLIALRRVTELTGWPVGHVLKFTDETRRQLCSSQLWAVAAPDRYERFIELTHAAKFEIGQGMPGGVLASKKAWCIEDLTVDESFPRARSAGEAGLRGAFGFPVLLRGEVEMILEFFSDRPEKPDGELMGLMDQIGAQLGIVIERKRAEQALRESELRHRALFEKSQDGVLLGDVATKRFTNANPAICRLLGYERDELVQLSVMDIHPPEALPGVLADFEAMAMKKKAVALNTPCLRKDGSIVYADISAGLAEIDGRLQLVGIFRDITERLVAEEEVRKLSRAVEASPAAVVITDKEGAIEYVNPKFTTLTGYSAREALGQNPSILNAGVQSEAFYAELWETIRSGSEWHGEFCNKKKNGDIFWEHASISPLKNRSGEITHFVAVKEDITDKKLAEDALRVSEKQYRLLIENLQAGVCVFAPDDRVLLLNRHASELLGLGGEAPVEGSMINPDWRLVDGSKRPIPLRNYPVSEIVRAKTSIEDMVVGIERPGGDPITWIIANGYPVFDAADELQQIVITFIDITALKQAEKIAMAASRAKSDFLANMSHEIRTPLNAVIGLSYLLSQTPLEKRQSDYLHKIHSSANGLLGILNDILDFSKVEAGRMELERVEFSLRTVVDELIAMFGVPTREKGLELVLDVAPDIPHYLLGDPLRLRQVLVNLCSNAVKFTSEGQIVVRVDRLDRSDDTALLRFSVSDTGLGMSADQVAGLFSPFTQADVSTTRKYGGTGLGLSISQALVGKMGGRIEVESTPDEGSRFSFAVSFACSAHSTVPPSGYGLDRLRVLVVEDNPELQRALTRMIGSIVSDVTISGTAEQGLEEIERAKAGDHAFDLVLMDCFLPGMDGIEATRRISAEQALGEPPAVVISTGRDDEQIRRQARDAGAFDFVTKPLTRSTVVDMLMTVLARSANRHLVKAATHRSEMIEEQLTGMRVLLVEDNDINREVATELLVVTGCEVDVAHNGKMAVKAVLDADPSYHAVLMDLQMPEMDGYQAARRIREHERFKSLPIIALTADVVGEVRQRVTEAGIDDYVSKPIDPQVLYSTLARWLVRPADMPSEETVGAPPNGAGALSSGLPQIDGVDLNDGLARVGGRLEPYRRILSMFVKRYADAPGKIRRLFADGAMEEVRHLVHSMKGVAGSIGASELRNRFAELESKIGRDDQTDTDREGPVQRLEIQLEIVVGSITQWLQTTDAPGEPPIAGSTNSEPVDLASIRQQLDALATMLAEGDLDARDAATMLTRDANHLGLHAELADLMKDIRGLDFESAAGRLEQIADRLDANPSG